LKDYPDGRVISGVRVVTPTKVLTRASLTIYKNYIVEIEGSQETFAEEKVDWLIPGLIDTHVHGAGGADIMDARMDSLLKVAQTLIKLGTTAFLATTMTADESQLSESLKVVNNFIRISNCLDYSREVMDQSNLNDLPYIAECLGVHLEGPFISGQFSGAQKSDYLREPSVSLLNKLHTWSGNNLKILTLAPELSKCEAVINESIRLGIIPSAGHSAADWFEAQQAKNWGIRHITHGFNAMRQLHHRDPGLIGMALADDGFMVEIIADLVHIHQCILGILYRLKGADRLILISDGMRALGMSDGEYELGGQTVFVCQGRARIADGNLAGAVASLLDGVRMMIFKVGVPIPEAVRMASLVPAKLLGLDQSIGSLERGKEATFLRLDPDWNLKEVWVHGKMVQTK
jgi:N-acetylglucosamine-6-phosphate deacetylase